MPPIRHFPCPLCGAKKLWAKDGKVRCRVEDCSFTGELVWKTEMRWVDGEYVAMKRAGIRWDQ